MFLHMIESSNVIFPSLWTHPSLEKLKSRNVFVFVLGYGE